MNKYIEVLGSGLGSRVSTAIQVAGSPEPTAKEVVIDMGASLVGGAVGAYAWKKHRVLGFFGGSGAAYAIAQAAMGHYGEAVGTLGTNAAAVAGSLAWKKHPVLGYVLGEIMGSMVMAVVPGTAQHRFVTNTNKPAAKK